MAPVIEEAEEIGATVATRVEIITVRSIRVVAAQVTLETRILGIDHEM